MKEHAHGESAGEVMKRNKGKKELPTSSPTNKERMDVVRERGMCMNCGQGEFRCGI